MPMVIGPDETFPAVVAADEQVVKALQVLGKDEVAYALSIPPHHKMILEAAHLRLA